MSRNKGTTMAPRKMSRKMTRNKGIKTAHRKMSRKMSRNKRTGIRIAHRKISRNKSIMKLRETSKPCLLRRRQRRNRGKRTSPSQPKRSARRRRHSRSPNARAKHRPKQAKLGPTQPSRRNCTQLLAQIIGRCLKSFSSTTLPLKTFSCFLGLLLRIALRQE